MKRLLVVVFALASTLAAQQPGDFGAPGKPKAYVTYGAEPQTVPAGRRSLLELHFRVVPGFHINSHSPKSDLLIPTTLTLDAAPGLLAGKPDYPPGTEYSLAVSSAQTQPEDKLDVYTGGFSIRLPVEAKPGQHTFHGQLRYQACDHQACYPPRSLPIEIPFTAK